MTAVRGRSAIRWRCGVTLLTTAALVMTGCAGHGKSANDSSSGSTASPRHSTPSKSKSLHPHTLVFEITGHGELSSLTYVINGEKTSERSVGLPWRKTISLPAREGGYAWSLKTHQDSGSSHGVVSVDGHPITNGFCQGGGCNTEDSGSIRD
jgi:hypothetical protein